MQTLRIAMVQMNSVVGDVEGNLARMLEWLEKARQQEANLVVFPEMALAGYPPEDLLFRPAFIDALEEAHNQMAAATRGLMAIYGTVFRSGGLINSAAVGVDGQFVTRVAKRHLPNYGVFDEERYFRPGRRISVLEWGDWKIGVSVCEDLWYPDGPYLAQARSGAQILVNVSASPYSRGKGLVREQMMVTRADDAAAYLVWTNMVGAQDELVFDGQSMVVSPEGDVLARGPSFDEQLLLVDVERAPGEHRRWIDPRWRLGEAPDPVEHVAIAGGPKIPSYPMAKPKIIARLPVIEELYQALVTGVRDYVAKNRFGHVVIGLSGGIDSALTAVIACDALGAHVVHGVFMPSNITSTTSYDDAYQLADRLGIDWREIAIGPIMEQFEKQLAPSFGQKSPPDLTEENLQARIRGSLLMALSNKMGWLVLTTGNKSEMATGYSTLYGDMAGGFAVLKDVLKTDVFRLAEWVNHLSERIPHNVLVKPPSAELRPDQRDEDSLPPYAILDQILEGYVENDLSVESLIASGIEEQFVHQAVGLVNRNEYKRRQAPIGIKVTPRAFGRDRRMPVTGRFE